jgi:hypothetical protein
MMGINFRQYIQKSVSITPLVTFRMLFGVMMFMSTLRFWLKGWITTQYVDPSFHFTYPGFEWVKPLGNEGMHILYLFVGLASILIALGWFYRVAIVVFFLCFTYIELIDVTYYLNHYYFISLISFLLIFLPAHRCLSFDVYFQRVTKIDFVPLWMIGCIRLQLGIVYFFAGLAKLNSDWLIHAQPMKIWLPTKSHLPLIGDLMYKEWVAYLFSWFGAVYDLFIVFFLLCRRTRAFAYIVVLGFLISTAVFFPSIGMFPYIMMASSLFFLVVTIIFDFGKGYFLI